MCCEDSHKHWKRCIAAMCICTHVAREFDQQQLSNFMQQANAVNLILMGDLNGKSQEWNNSTSDRHGDLIEDNRANNRLIIRNDGQPTHRGG